MKKAVMSLLVLLFVTNCCFAQYPDEYPSYDEPSEPPEGLWFQIEEAQSAASGISMTHYVFATETIPYFNFVRDYLTIYGKNHIEGDGDELTGTDLNVVEDFISTMTLYTEHGSSAASAAAVYLDMAEYNYNNQNYVGAQSALDFASEAIESSKDYAVNATNEASLLDSYLRVKIMWDGTFGDSGV